MEKKILLVLILPLLLVGCNKNNKEYISSFNESVSVSSECTSSEDKTNTSYEEVSEFVSSTLSSISEEQVSISSEYDEILTLLSEIKAKAMTLKAFVNEYDISESNTGASIDLKLMARFDFIGSKSGMGSNYHLLMSDGNDYIYVKVSKKIYEKTENSIGETFHLEGNVSYYCGNAEITVSNDIFSESEVNISSNEEYQAKSIPELFDITDNMGLNCKGCNAGGFVSFKGEYYAKMDDVVALFRNGNDIIFVHGPSKWLNGMSVGKVYELNGVMNMRNFRPGFECLSKKEINETITDINESELNTLNQDVYKIKYEVDKNKSYPEYTALFKKVFTTEGYVNYYTKDGKYYTVIEFASKDKTYDTYQNAKDAKTLFIKNEEATNLSTEKDDKYNPFTSYYGLNEKDEPIKIKVICVPYLWQSQGYWQIYAIANTIEVMNND